MSKITKKGNHIFVPDHVTIPYIEGDGVGHEITPVSQKIVNAAIKQAYNGTRSIEWKEVLAGEKAFKQTGSWLPDETMEAFREYIVGINYDWILDLRRQCAEADIRRIYISRILIIFRKL